MTPTGHSLLDTSTDCVKVIGVDGRLLGMNPEGMCLMEIDDFSTVKDQEWWNLWPEAHRATLKAAVSQAVSGGVARFSADCPTAKGTPKHWDVIVSPVHGDAGEVVRLISISRDVTREVHLAGERALVASELAHRIKNFFAIVDGMIGMSARSAPQAKEFVAALRTRVAGLGRSISYIYGQPASGEKAGHKMHGLLQQLLKPYEQGGADSLRIAITGDDLDLAADAITPLALIFNELATNALKYGSLGQPHGRLAVSTHREGDAYTIRWIETGGAPASPPASSGFGATLVDRTVKLQLEGSIIRDWTAEGLDARLTLPIRQLAT